VRAEGEGGSINFINFAIRASRKGGGGCVGFVGFALAKRREAASDRQDWRISQL